MIIDVKSQAAVVQKEAVKEFSLQDVARKVNNVFFFFCFFFKSL